MTSRVVTVEEVRGRVLITDAGCWSLVLAPGVIGVLDIEIDGVDVRSTDEIPEILREVSTVLERVAASLGDTEGEP